MARGERTDGGAGKGFYLFLAALGVVGIGVLFWLRDGGGAADVAPLSVAEASVEADSSAYAAARGPEDAPVTMVEFADYTCSHCRNFASLPARAIARDYVRTGQVRWLLYDFPLSERTNAIPAALAARCAGDQGRYWEMHDLLFQNQQVWSADDSPRDRFEDYADEIGIEVGAWEECYSSRRHVRQIVASRKYGEVRGVSGTPTIFVNEQRAPNYGFETIQRLIERSLSAERASAGSRGAGDATAGG